MMKMDMMTAEATFAPLIRVRCHVGLPRHSACRLREVGSPGHPSQRYGERGKFAREADFWLLIFGADGGSRVDHSVTGPKR
jgi:hypothetical protein